MEQKERLIQELREGEVRDGKITSVRNFGVFVDLGGADGLAHLSELSWERDKSPMDLFRVGDEVKVYITKIDPENKKIALSLRRAQPEQWDGIVAKYQESQVVIGRITKLVTFGAFARIEGPVEGLIHVSELVDRRIGHPKEVVREGDLLPLKVVRIERDRQRLGLSLRRARDEGEGMGFVFSDGGEVLSVPEGVRKEFEEREGPPPAQTESYDGERDASESAVSIASDDDEPAIDAAVEQPAHDPAQELAASAGEPAPASEAEAMPAREPEPEPMSQLAEQLSEVVSAMDEPLNDVAAEPLGDVAAEQLADVESVTIVDESPAPVVETLQPVESREEAVGEPADHITAG
jgi:predicted RNA-binding protein with RPS1 domain